MHLHHASTNFTAARQQQTERDGERRERKDELIASSFQPESCLLNTLLLLLFRCRRDQNDAIEWTKKRRKTKEKKHFKVIRFGQCPSARKIWKNMKEKKKHCVNNKDQLKFQCT